MLTKEEILGAVARGWCTPENRRKTIDPDLASAISDSVWDALYPPNLGCATTAELLEELTARSITGGYALYRTVGSR